MNIRCLLGLHDRYLTGRHVGGSKEAHCRWCSRRWTYFPPHDRWWRMTEGERLMHPRAEAEAVTLVTGPSNVETGKR